MKNIVLKISYNGFPYFGSQKQKGFPTVQGELEKKISAMLKENIKTVFASRTDRGVHAFGNFLNFHTNSNIPAQKLYRINKYVENIKIRKVYTADKEFSTRHNAEGKKYMYLINTNPHISPFFINNFWHINKKMDVNKIKEACSYFIGRHDFRNFSRKIPTDRNTVREIDKIKLVTGSNFLKFYITGKSFLYNQIRFMIYSLHEVGLFRRSPASIKDLLEDEYKKLSGKAVPGGLYLIDVFYDCKLNYLQEEKK
ncbi:MAG: tRNA pseudouridine(38-40) synthase TruA [Candidatus Muiribacteriota bacterium]